MNDFPHGLDRDQLLAHAQFVRALAHRLVADEAQADDLAQDTWLAVLARGPRHGERLRAWLGTIVRNAARQARRAQQRRAHHEHHAHHAHQERASPASGAGPGADEIVASMEVHRRVVDAALALHEPYRSTVLLRYFADLPADEIARRVGVPVETVRTRLKRAVALLRERLDEQHGGRRSVWVAALGLLDRTEPLVAPSLASTSWITGVLLMSTKLKVATALLLVLLACGLVWQLLSRADARRAPASAPAVATSAPVGEPPVPAGRDVLAANVPAPVTQTETPSPATADEPSGSMLVRVRWGKDGTPAVGVPVRIALEDEQPPFPHALHGITGAGGVYVADRVPVGAVVVAAAGVDIFEANTGLGSPPRTANEYGYARVALAPDQHVEIELEIPKWYLTIDGVVVDGQGTPVAGAAIWMSGSLHHYTYGHEIARTGADGRFHLEGISNMRSLGARARGFAPSPTCLLSGAGERIRNLRIVLHHEGGSVSGMVLGPDGRPVPRALVMVGQEFQPGVSLLDDGQRALAGPPPERVLTDDAGKFFAESIELGTQPVAVRARGLTCWQGSVEVKARATSEMRIALDSGVTITGTVTGPSGDPVRAAIVRAGPGDGGLRGEFVASIAKTDEDGFFELTELMVGEIPVMAEDQLGGKASTMLQAKAGDELVWDAVLSRGLELRGRVIGERDQPLAGWKVNARGSSEATPDWRAEAFADADGRFTIANCPDVVSSLTVAEVEASSDVTSLSRGMYPCFAQRDVRPADGEVVLRILDDARSTAFITGTLLDPDGKPFEKGHLTLIGAHVWCGQWAMTGVKDGVIEPFRIGPFPPAVYSIRMDGEGYPAIQLGQRELRPNATLDLGTLQLAKPGWLAATVRRADGKPVDRGIVTLYDEAEKTAFELSVLGDTVRSEPLRPGRYIFYGAGDDLLTTRRAVDIVAGEEARFELEIPAARIVGEAAHDFTLTDLEGQAISFAERRGGKPAFLVFFGVACPPCRAEIPHLNALHEKFAARGLAVIAVNAWNEPAASVRALVNDQKIRFPVLLDGRAIGMDYAISAVPTGFWIDRDGKVIERDARDPSRWDAIARELLAR